MSEIFKNLIFVMYNLRYYLLIFWLAYLLRQLAYAIKYFKSDYKKESNIGLRRFLYNSKYSSEGLLFMRLEKIKRHSKILTNLQVPTKEGIAEIDIIYININGLFMITSKNYSGWIYGSTKSAEWTRKLLGIKHSFLNILQQNEKKIEFLEEALPETEIQQLIIFNKKCELKNLKVNRRVVIKERDLERRVLKHRFRRTFTEERVDEIYNQLKPYANQVVFEKIALIDRATDILVNKIRKQEQVTNDEN